MLTTILLASVLSVDFMHHQTGGVVEFYTDEQVTGTGAYVLLDEPYEITDDLLISEALVTGDDGLEHVQLIMAPVADSMVALPWGEGVVPMPTMPDHGCTDGYYKPNLTCDEYYKDCRACCNDVAVEAMAKCTAKYVGMLGACTLIACWSGPHPPCLMCVASAVSFAAWCSIDAGAETKKCLRACRIWDIWCEAAKTGDYPLWIYQFGGDP